MYNEPEDDDDVGFNDNGDDDDDDDGDAEIEDDDDDDGGDSIDDEGNEGNFVDGVTAYGDVSNIKHFIGETRWCFLKHKNLQAGEEITCTFCKTTSEQKDCTVLYETTVLWTLDLIRFNGIST